MKEETGGGGNETEGKSKECEKFVSAEMEVFAQHDVDLGMSVNFAISQSLRVEND